MKGPKEAEYKQPKAESEYQGESSSKNVEPREGYIIKEVANSKGDRNHRRDLRDHRLEERLNRLEH